MIIFSSLVLLGLSPFVCIAKENSQETKKSSKPQATITDKKKKAENENKNKDPKKEEKQAKENKQENSAESEMENNNADKEKDKKENAKDKPYAPKINSIIPEKSEKNKEPKNQNENANAVTEPENFNLPEVDESAITEKPDLIAENKQSTRSVPKTIIAWCLILLGLAIILATIILNSKMPQDMSFRYHEKHGIKSKKHKNNYRLKYK